MTRYIASGEHYARVLEKTRGVRRALWIGTADIKDLHVKRGRGAEPFLNVLAALLHRGVEARLIHAKEPGPNFRRDFDNNPVLARCLERVLCPRAHFKLMIFDLEAAYIGSANLTGAGMGMKSGNRRNFEAGVLTTDPVLVAAAARQFDDVWLGRHCAQCGRQAHCGDRIAE